MAKTGHGSNKITLHFEITLERPLTGKSRTCSNTGDTLFRSRRVLVDFTEVRRTFFQFFYHFSQVDTRLKKLIMQTTEKDSSQSDLKDAKTRQNGRE